MNSIIEHFENEPELILVEPIETPDEKNKRRIKELLGEAKEILQKIKNGYKIKP